MDNKALFKLSYGLFVITTSINDKHNGCITNTAIQVANNPNMITFAINKQNLTHDMLLYSKKFTISILTTSSNFEIYRHFGFQSGFNVDKFKDFKDAKMLDNGTMYITKGTNAYISGEVVQTVDMGSHTLFIANISEMEVLNNEPSVTYEYYRENIKPKPVDTGKKENGQTVWRCTICGYEYVGEELPENFVCPLCKHPASDFEKVAR